MCKFCSFSKEKTPITCHCLYWGSKNILLSPLPWTIASITLAMFNTIESIFLWEEYNRDAWYFSDAGLVELVLILICQTPTPPQDAAPQSCFLPTHWKISSLICENSKLRTISQGSFPWLFCQFLLPFHLPPLGKFLKLILKLRNIACCNFKSTCFCWIL